MQRMRNMGFNKVMQSEFLVLKTCRVTCLIDPVNDIS